MKNIQLALTIRQMDQITFTMEYLIKNLIIKNKQLGTKIIGCWLQHRQMGKQNILPIQLLEQQMVI